MATVHKTNQLYQEIMGVEAPWEVTGVTMDNEAGKLTIRIEHNKEIILPCPICGQNTSRYDHWVRVLRHLDTCQYETSLIVNVPRIECKSDKVHQIEIPFAEKHSRFSRKFEAAILESLIKNKSVSKVAENFKLSWEEVNGIMQREKNKA